MATLLIILHGSGGTGPGLRTLFEALPIDKFHGRTFRQVADLGSIEILTPTAPLRRYTPCAGVKMNVWFDRSERFNSEGLDSREDIEGVNESLAKVCCVV